MKFGDKSKAVKELQNKLLASGYELPKYGADGDFGNETREALKRYAEDHWFDVEKLVVPFVLDDETDYMENVIDLREEQIDPPDRCKVKNGKVVKRDLSKVDGVVLHQTAVFYAVSSRQISRAGGDRHKALHNRAFKVASHAVAFGGKQAGIDCGHAIATNPLSWYMNHAHKLNSRSLGLEIEGKYPGLTSPSGEEVSDDVVKAACSALKYLVEEGRKQGAPIKYLWAHRQSSSTRRSDPGEELWKKVGLEYGVKVLGLETQPRKTWGDGLPVPLEWDPDGKGSW